jgi:hypothetical protein
MRLADRFQRLIAVLPAEDSVTLSARTLQAWLDADPPVGQPAIVADVPSTWRERIWTVPCETRLSLDEVAEAVGQKKQWVYRRTGAGSRYTRIPHRKLDGVLIFTAGEIRQWVAAQEEVVVPLTDPAWSKRSN